MNVENPFDESVWRAREEGGLGWLWRAGGACLTGCPIV